MLTDEPCTAQGLEKTRESPRTHEVVQEFFHQQYKQLMHERFQANWKLLLILKILHDLLLSLSDYHFHGARYVGSCRSCCIHRTVDSDPNPKSFPAFTQSPKAPNLEVCTCAFTCTYVFIYIYVCVYREPLYMYNYHMLSSPHSSYIYIYISYEARRGSSTIGLPGGR